MNYFIVSFVVTVFIASFWADGKARALFQNGSVLGCSLDQKYETDFEIQSVVHSYLEQIQACCIKFCGFSVLLFAAISYAPIWALLLLFWTVAFWHSIHRQYDIFRTKLLFIKYKNGWHSGTMFPLSYQAILGKNVNQKPFSPAWFCLPLLLYLFPLLQSLLLGSWLAALAAGAHFITLLLYLFLYWKARSSQTHSDPSNQRACQCTTLVTRYRFFALLLFSALDGCIFLILHHWITIPSSKPLLAATLLLLITLVCVFGLVCLHDRTQYAKTIAAAFQRERIHVDEDIYWRYDHYSNPNDSRTFVSAPSGKKVRNLANRQGILYQAVGVTLITCTLLFLCGLFYTYSFASYDLTFRDHYLKINSPLYSQVVDLKQVKSVRERPQIPIHYPVHAIQNADLSIGRFYTEEFDQCSFYTHRAQELCILLTTKDDQTIILNLPTDTQTAELYGLLKQRLYQ